MKCGLHQCCILGLLLIDYSQRGNCKMKTKPIATNQEVKRHPNNNISLCQFLGRRWVKDSSCQLLWLPFHLEKQNKLERHWLQPSRADWISLCQESQIPHPQTSFLSRHLWKFTLVQSDTQEYPGKLFGKTPKTSTLQRTGAMFKVKEKLNRLNKEDLPKCKRLEKQWGTTSQREKGSAKNLHF